MSLVGTLVALAINMQAVLAPMGCVYLLMFLGLLTS